MQTPTLSIVERQNIDTGLWFAKLSPALQQAILDAAQVRRLRDGELVAARGAPAEEWCSVALGAVRVSSVSLAGKQVSLTYVEPGTWFGDIAFRGPAAHPRWQCAWRHDPADRAQARLQGLAGGACRALRRSAVPELPPPAPDVRCGGRPQHAPARGTPGAPVAAAGAQLRHRRGRGDPHRPGPGPGRPRATAWRLAPARQSGAQGFRASWRLAGRADAPGGVVARQAAGPLSEGF